MSQMSNRTRRGLRSLIVYLVTLALISTSISTVFADEPSKDYKSSIDSALNWISTNQSPDGCWGDGSNLRDTSEIAGYLKENSYHADSVSKAGIWLCSQDAINNDFAAHELQFINDEKTHNEMLDNLLSAQNDDGGWGLAQYFESDVLDTVIVLEALLSEKSPNLEAIKKGISYIINNQDSSGGWSYLPGSSCEIFLTAKTALLLGNFTRITGLGGTELNTSIKKSSEYLVSNQLPDKTWGTDIDSLPGTLIAYRVLLRSSGIKAVSSLEDTILSLQDKDGSFSKDAYTTMLAAAALQERSEMPEASIKSIKLFKGADKDTETYTYNTDETFLIKADYQVKNTDVKLNFYIKTTDGRIIPVGTNGPAEWNTGKNPPGTYTVLAQLKDAKYGNVLASMEQNFEIVPVFKVENVFVGLNPHFTRVGSPVNVKAEVTLVNQSNIDKQVTVYTSVYDGDNIIQSSKALYDTKASDIFSVQKALEFTPDVSVKKDYIVKSEVYDSDVKVAEGQSVFNVLPTIDNNKEFDFTLKRGQDAKQDISVIIPKLPPKVDVVFAFDLTGSMGSILSTSKNKASQIMNELNGLGVDINYGVISYMDYPNYGYGSYGDYPYKMGCAITSSTTDVSKAISSLNLGNGNDSPESYTRMLYESYADSSIGWREGSKKIVVNFGDNIPHDDNINEGVPGKSGTNNTGKDPGRDGVLNTSDDLDLQTVLKGMVDNNIVLLACQTYGSYLDYWSYWAGLTGGKGYDTSSGSLAKDVTAAIKSTLISSDIKGLKLVPSDDFKGWITGNYYNSPSGPIDSYSGPTEVSVPFSVYFNVPQDASKNLYHFKMDAVDINKVRYGTYDFYIDIPTGEKAPELSTSISTDKPGYLPQEDVKLHLSATNITNHTESCTGKLKILDAAGNTISEIANIDETFDPGQTKIFDDFSWNTQNTLAGNYKAIISWSAGGSEIASAEATFAVLPDRNVTNSVTTDRIAYNANSPVTITESVYNASTNSVLSDLTVKTDITNYFGNIVWEDSTPVKELLKGTRIPLKLYWNTGKNNPGTYSVTSRVYGSDGVTLLCSASAPFSIVDSQVYSFGVSGSLDVAPREVKPSGTAEFTIRTVNTGNTSIADLIRNLYVIDPSTKKVLWENSSKIDLAVGKSVTDSVYWKPAGIKPGDYLVLYQGVLSDNSVVTLGSGGIRILKDETGGTPSEPSKPGTGNSNSGSGSSSGDVTVDIPVVDVPAASPASDLAVSIYADKSIYMDNDTITYTIDYKNLLASKSGDFELTVQIPDNTSIVDAGGGVITGAAITWKVSALEGLASGKKVYKVKLINIPKSEYLISNTAKITGKNLINTDDDQSTILVMARTEKYGKLSHKAYLKGYPGNFFGPERQITRAEVAAIFARIMNLTASKRADLKDVPENHWASEYISAAINAGIFTGYEDNSFHPDAAITRAELAAVVSRYYNIKASKPLEIHYNDISGHWALNYIEEVNRFKFITGYEDGSFRPDEKIKRSETVTMVNRMLMRGPLNVKSPSFTDINGHWAQGQIEEGARNHEAGLDITGNETVN